VVEYVSTNLFESPAQTLVNTVNTVGVMGKGIANDFRRLYPEMFEQYREFCHRGEFVVGQLYLFRTPHKWVLNFPTKKHWRNPSQLEWIEAGLLRFLETYSQYGITSVSFPQLGTGNGGLDWERVRPLMERYLGQARIPVYVHLRPCDPKFIPEHLRAADVFQLSQELQTARQDVTFEQFVVDLTGLLGGRVRVPEDVGELASLEVQERSGVRIIPGEQILDFWQALRLQGALKLSALPESFRDEMLALPEKLVRLDYIKRMEFGADHAAGLRYAPRSISAPPTSIDVHSE
jgi:O-acetyl-ADP-ribose deacetylase (regulator of RNase III)